MRSILAGLRTLVIPWGLTNTSTPHRVIGQDIPAELVSWGAGVGVVLYSVDLWYYNATDYFWTAIGTFFGIPAYFEGTHDLGNGVYNTMHISEAPVPIVVHGSNVMNSNDFTHKYENVTVAFDTDPTAPGRLRIGPTKIVAATEEGVSAVAVSSGTDTTTSATFVSMAGTGSTTSFSFRKEYDETRVKLVAEGNLFSATAGAEVRVALRIDGVDYDVTNLFINTAGVHIPFAGFAYVGGGVVAGDATYTVQARWRRVSGTGTLTRNTSNWLSISAKEVD